MFFNLRKRTKPFDWSYPEYVNKLNRHYYHRFLIDTDLLEALTVISDRSIEEKASLTETGKAFAAIGLKKITGEPLDNPQVSSIRKLVIAMNLSSQKDC